MNVGHFFLSENDVSFYFSLNMKPESVNWLTLVVVGPTIGAVFLVDVGTVAAVGFLVGVCAIVWGVFLVGVCAVVTVGFSVGLGPFVVVVPLASFTEARLRWIPSFCTCI